MKTLKKLFILAIISINLSACYTTRATIGTGPIGKDENVRVYSKTKQFYLIGGLIPLSTSSPLIPGDKNCQIKTKFTWFDLFLSGITFQLVNARTTYVLVHN